MKSVLKTALKWYDAREYKPVKNSNVIAITVRQNGEFNGIYNLVYEDEHFNGEKYSMDEWVRYWAPLPEGQEVFSKIQEEDDF